jgi:phosphoketolase
LDGHKLEDFVARAPGSVTDPVTNPRTPEDGGDWMRSYKPEELVRRTATLILS